MKKYIVFPLLLLGGFLPQAVEQKIPLTIIRWLF